MGQMLRRWSPRFVVRDNGTHSLSTQIFKALCHEIQIGRLAPGDALPGARELAAALEVNHKTVAKVYARLAIEGWVDATRRRGTFVAETIPPQEPHTVAQTDMLAALADRARAVGHPLLWPAKAEVRFDDGLPDQTLIPVDALARSFSGAVRSASRKNMFSYADPSGTVELRKAVSQMLNLTRGMSTRPEEICITRGSQLAIWLVAQTFVQRGDAVVFESLTYPPAVDAFSASGAQIVRLNSGPGTLDADELETVCRRNRVKVVYTPPHNHFPSTTTLPADQRMRLKMLARQFGFLIVEDDYDHEFHYDSLPMFPMASNDPGGNIIYLSSFSKALAPSLRIGFIAARREICEGIARMVGVTDRQGDVIGELAIAELMENGELVRHLRRSHGIYRKRRDLMVEMARNILPEFASTSSPSGGLACWLELHQPIDSGVHRRNREQHGIQYLVSSDCAADSRLPDVGLRLGFASLPEPSLERSLTALRRSLENLHRLAD